MTELLARFHRVLVEEIRSKRPEYLDGPFTVAEIYQDLVPYGTHRDRLGVAMNGDYEDALLRLLAGEGEYLLLDSPAAVRDLREELATSNPNTGVYREYAAADVRLNPERLGAMANGGQDGSAATGGPLGEDPAGDDAVDMGALAPSVDDTAAVEAGAYMGATPATPDAPLPGTDDGEPQTQCRWCRGELPQRANLNFCPHCGTDVHVVPCPSCGEELERDWRFCFACGTEVAS